MATCDMDATIRFWRDLLQMKLVLAMGKPGYRHYFFRISETDLIAFFEWPDVRPVEEKDHGYPVSGPAIFDHISFGVATEDDLWILKDRLEKAGFWVSEEIDHGFIHSIYSFDPNGIPIEFSVAVDEVDIRRNPKLIDSHPTPTALEGPEPQPDQWPPVTRPTPAEERAIYPGEGEQVRWKASAWNPATVASKPESKSPETS